MLYLLALVVSVILTSAQIPSFSGIKRPNWDLIEPLDVDTSSTTFHLSPASDPSLSSRRDAASKTFHLDSEYFDPDLGVIPLGRFDSLSNVTDESIRNAYRFLFRTIGSGGRDRSNFLLYPYSLSVDPVEEADDTTLRHFPGGSAISLAGVGSGTGGVYFDSAELGRSAALYDLSIGVLKAHRDSQDLFHASDTFCAATATYLGHWGPECVSFADAEKGPTRRSQLVFIDPETDLGGLDSVTELLDVVDLLIFPDFIGSRLDDVVALFSEAKVTEMLQSFVSDYGKTILATGKSGYILERIGVGVPSRTYASWTLVTSQTNVAHVRGCDVEPDPTYANFSSFVKATLCVGVPSETYLLESYRVQGTLPPEWTVLVDFDPSVDYGSMKFKSVSNGLKWNVGRNSFVPRIMYRSFGKGIVLVDHSNPLYHSDYFGWFYNVIFTSMGRSLLVNRAIDFAGGQPIPAMESGVLLSLNHTFMNVFSSDITALEMKFWVPKLVEVRSGQALTGPFYDECQPDSSMIVPNGALEGLSGWRCNWDLVRRYESVAFGLSVEIMDYSVTQLRTGVLMGWTELSFNDSRTGDEFQVELNAGGFYVNTMVAALLRGDVNPDPSSFYPLEGEGNYIDNVLPVENKEDTEAFDVVHVAIVPIVSPAVDGDDQSKVIEVVRFWDQYYFESTNQHAEYPFPFVHDTDHDYLDYKFLTGKGVLFTANWDTPVKLNKIDRDGTFPPLLINTSLSMKNINYSTSVSESIVMRQTHFANSDHFFEHATQQLLVYVDTTTEEGAAARYGDIHAALPASRIVPLRDVEKTEKVFVRNDIYFYNSGDQYLMPKNINYSHVISIDRYPKYAGGCYNGNAYPIVEGYFNKSLPGGLRYNEYGNEVGNRCDKVVLPYQDVETLTGGEVTKTRYLIPIVDEDITKASDLLFFDEVTGEYEDYPEVKFIYAYSFVLPLDPAQTRRGGYIDFTLPHAFLAPETPAAYFSADHVAFHSHSIDKPSARVRANFKRGRMPNEAWGKVSYQTVMIENVDSMLDQFEVSVDIYELKYDITAEPNEQYIFRETILVNASRKPHFSLPAIRMEFTLNRTKLDSTTPTAMMPYELIEPLARYGVYHQELRRHTTVFGLAESHVVKDPGIVVESGGFSVISQVGISSIPFIDYLTVGSGQVIPAGTETSRIEWNDIWQRRWVQPMRSVFPDVPPIPPPLRNFMMTTTFELTKAGTTERVLEWNSEEELDIRVHMKLKNNYPKHFEITTSTANRIFSVEKNVPSRVFFYPYDSEVTNVADNYEYLSNGHRSFYGDCFTAAGTRLSGQTLTQPMRDLLPSAWHCSSNLLNATSCVEALMGIPTVTRCPLDPPTGDQWNWAPDVESYYPTSYIKGNMWDMTHYDYDDNAFDKAYKYHMDNLLPNLDVGILKPHNIIAHPIFKGYGYQITYDKTFSVPRFSTYQGWWSDNLQNKDHTVLAGQSNSNDISVDKVSDSLIPEWIEITDLHDTGTSKFNRVSTTLKNIYGCEFNRHRIKMHTSNTVKYYPNNVIPNNVIPIIPDLDRYDSRYTNYACDTGKVQYTPTTISQVDNIVVTNDARDWLYFGANLRGGAKETINVVSRLSPFTERKFEGDTKVNDGGRFVYWNPANGPNSFLVVDNPVNVVKSSRCDLSLEVELFPKATSTFDADIYHLVRVADDEEILREYTSPIYINHYGFGDTSTSVYVGGTEGSKSVIEPGEKTYVKLTFYNNAGWDWNLFAGAIEFDYQGSEPLNADAIMKNYVHAIQVPIVYNFLTLHIPPEIKPHISIIPSDHCKRMTSLFFDFQNINVATIMDGFKADYFYQLTVLPSFPASLRGRLHEIPITLNLTNFESLPGYNDETAPGYHDYTIEVPSIVFGVPYGNDVATQYQGKVYHTLGTSSNLKVSIPLNSRFDVVAARFINSTEIEMLRTVAAEPENMVTNLRNHFSSLTDTRSVPVQATGTASGDYDYYEADLSSFFDVYPKRVDASLPPEAETHILIHTNAAELPYGKIVVDFEPELSYLACGGLTKASSMTASPNYRSVQAKGASLEIEYEGELLERELEDGRTITNINQILYPHESGTMSVTARVTNAGSDVAYNLNVTLAFDPDVEILLDQMDSDVGYRVDTTSNVLYIESGYDLGPSMFEVFVIMLHYSPSAELKHRTDIENFPPEREFIPTAIGTIDLTPSLGDNTVVQPLDPYSYTYVLRAIDLVNLDGDKDLSLCSVDLTAIANQPVVDGEPLWYLFYRRNATETDPGAEEDETASWVFLSREEAFTLTTTYPCVTQRYRVRTQNRIDEQYLADGYFELYHVDPRMVGSVAAAVGGVAIAIFLLVLVLVLIISFTLGSGSSEENSTPRVVVLEDEEPGEDLEEQGTYFMRGRMVKIYGMKKEGDASVRTVRQEEVTDDAKEVTDEEGEEESLDEVEIVVEEN